MNHTPFDPTHANPFVEQLSDLVASPSSSRLLYLLPPCLILLAIDVVVRLSSPNRQIEPPVEIVESPSMKMQRRKEDFKRLSERAHQVLANFRELDKRLLVDGVRSKDAHRLLQRQRNFAHHRKRLAVFHATLSHPSPALPLSPACPLTTSPAPTPAPIPKKPELVGKPFQSFCERLLTQNKIWKQERQIRALQRSLDTVRSSTCSNAFTAFCDRLLLSNTIWRLQRELGQLVSETEKLKRSRVAAVIRAAKQMVVDVRRERMTEEFVKELIAELDECRLKMANLREEHEKEMAEMAGDWRKDCRRLSREVERLKLAQDAYLWEQELSNGLEDELMTRLALSEWRFDPVAGSSVPELDEDTETLSEGESEQMSIMSNTSTSTFVGSAGVPSPSRKLSFEESTPSKRHRRAQLTPLKIVLRQSSSSSLSIANSPHSAISSPGTYEPASYVGFSFNPIFFAKKKEDDDTPTGVRTRAISLPSHNTGKEKASSQPKRVQWRF